MRVGLGQAERVRVAAFGHRVVDKVHICANTQHSGVDFHVGMIGEHWVDRVDQRRDGRTHATLAREGFDGHTILDQSFE